jgi:transposase-like protein
MNFSKSTVSALCAHLDPLVTARNERSLREQAFPFVLVDVLVLKVREGERVRALAALVAVGVSAIGYREILGLQLGDSESEASWASFLGTLQRHVHGASWQRCQTHLTRDVLEAAPRGLRDEVHTYLLALFRAPDLIAARTLLQQIVATYAEHAPKV